ncbi:MAG: cytochrome c biogenesis protein CcsA [Candidatus Acidiferrales bacterium]|jgi:ABC-type transport system involved in cytochrome c biogenesis permease subunit
MMNPYVLATLLFYAASLALYIWNLREPSRVAGIGATSCLVGGLILHYIALLDRSRMIHAVPYDDLFGSLSLFAWLLAATYLCLEAIHRRRAVGPFVLPIVLAVFLLAHLPEAKAIKAPPAQGPLFAFHVTLNIMAYAAFAISFVLSIIFLVQNSRLRGHKLGIVGWRFPALDVLEQMTRSSVLIGCCSLAAGMTAGLIWAHRLQGRYWDGDPKVLVTFLILAAYLGYTLLARTAAWRGARASALCIFNFVFVVFSYSIVNRYLSHFHRYF